MVTSRDDLRKWFIWRHEGGYDFMIVAVDTFDYGNYTIGVMEEDFRTEYSKVNGRDMQRVMEVYNLNMDMESQMKETRAFNFPEGFRK